MKITELEPKQLWANFASLNAVPRPSKKEDKNIKKDKLCNSHQKKKRKSLLLWWLLAKV